MIIVLYQIIFLSPPLPLFPFPLFPSLTNSYNLMIIYKSAVFIQVATWALFLLFIYILIRVSSSFCVCFFFPLTSSISSPISSSTNCFLSDCSAASFPLPPQLYSSSSVITFLLIYLSIYLSIYLFVGSLREQSLSESTRKMPKAEEISHPPAEQLLGFEYCIDSNPPWGKNSLCFCLFLPLYSLCNFLKKLEVSA